MTEEERRAVIEKAARAMQPEHFDILTDRMREGVRDEARRALEAVDYFTLRARLDALVEMGERLQNALTLRATKGVSGEYQVNASQGVWSDFCTALTTAKGE